MQFLNRIYSSCYIKISENAKRKHAQLLVESFYFQMSTLQKGRYVY